MANTRTPRNKKIRSELDAIISAVLPGTIIRTDHTLAQLNKITTRREVEPKTVSQLLSERYDLRHEGDGIWMKLEGRNA